MAYDPSTTEGYVRLLIGDTDDGDRLFSDAEITAFLNASGQDPNLAAAKAIRSTMAVRSRLSKRIEREGYKSEQHALDALELVASAFEKQALTGGGLVAVDFDLTDEHHESYRPKWRNLETEQNIEE